MAERLPRRAPAITVEPASTAPTTPPLGARLAALDRRYARSGLLGFISEVPQLGAVLLTLILAINAFTVAARQPDGTKEQTARGQAGRVENSDPRLGLVGILPGAAVVPYVAEAAHRLQTIALESPDASVVALFSFSRYVTPAKAAALLLPVKAGRAYYAPRGQGVAPGATAFSSVVDLAVDLPAQFLAAAASFDAQAKASETFAATVAGNNAEERAQKAEQLRDAKAYRAQARVLRQSCTCVFAVVARGPARVLAALGARPGIRVVDPGPPGVRDVLLEFRPLRPEVMVIEPTAGPAAP